MDKLLKMRFILLLSVTFMIIFMTLFAMQMATVVQPFSSAEYEDYRIGMITSDSIYDQSWGSLAYESQLLLEERFPVQVDLHAEQDSKAQQIVATETLIEEGAELIFGHGREFSPIFKKLAADHPQIHFVTLNGEATYENQTSFHVNQRTMGFFPGSIAGFMTESYKVGMIDVNDQVNEMTLAFGQGLAAVDSDITLYHRGVGSRDDEEKAAQIAQALVAAGVDVIFTTGNAFNRAVIHEAEKGDIYAIGFLTDQSYMAEDHVLTSMIQDVPQGYAVIVERYLSDEGLPSGDLVFDRKDGVYDLAPWGAMVPVTVQEQVEQQLERYRQGELRLEELDLKPIADMIHKGGWNDEKE